MNTHLDESGLLELILGASAPEVAHHIESCRLCRSEAERLRETVACCRDSIRAQAERDEVFWTNQRQRIRQRLPERVSNRFVARLAIAALVLVLAAVSALLLVQRPRSASMAITEPRQMSDDVADDALLQGIQTDAARDYPIALQPAVLISDERNAAMSALAATAPLHLKEKEQKP